VGGEGGQELDGLGDVPVDGGGADPEAGRELGIGLAVAEVDEGEQDLPPALRRRHRVPRAHRRSLRRAARKRRAELDTSTPDG
jgi:hypothetical protein